MSDRTLCTWRVRTALPLPEALPWQGPDRAVDIEIRRGSLGSAGATPSRRVEMLPEGQILYDAGPHARFLVTAERVVVDSQLPAEAPEWRIFLLGPILGLLCYLRGALPLHASAIRIGSDAVAIAGAAGAGKSTLAAALLRRGHRLVTDDICPVLGAEKLPLVLPTFPTLKLGAASLDALAIDSAGLPRIGFGEGKFLLARPGDFHPAPVPLRRVYLLEEAFGIGGERIRDVRGTEIFERLGSEIYRSEIGRILYSKPALFKKLAEVVSGLEVRRLRRSAGLAQLDEMAALLESDVAGG